jgi:hypothetical protein
VSWSARCNGAWYAVRAAARVESDDAEVVVIRWAGSGGGSISYHGLFGRAGNIFIVEFHPHCSSSYEYTISMPIDNFRIYERSNGSGPKLAQLVLGFLDGFPVVNALVLGRLAMVPFPLLI